MNNYRLRYMRTTDIPTVVYLDRRSFSTPWSVQAYTQQVKTYDYAHMVVLACTEPTPPNGPVQAWWQRLTGFSARRQRILGYGGLWHFGAEAHISTIASHPAFRGCGYGELLLAAMLRRSIRLSARYVALEVRQSNSVAQALYAKYGFQRRGIKRGYYIDNDEDAYDMMLSLEDATATRFIETRYRAFLRQLSLQDTYTSSPRPAP